MLVVVEGADLDIAKPVPKLKGDVWSIFRKVEIVS